jgi:hypothetical protein
MPVSMKKFRTAIRPADTTAVVGEYPARAGESRTR